MGHAVIVVDDHPLMRSAIRCTLDDTEASVILDASNLHEALQLIRGLNGACLALLDLGLPDVDGFEGLRALRTLCPDCPVVVISADDDNSTILRCIELGAAGFIPKTMAPGAIRDALRRVARGQIYLPPDIGFKDRGADPAARRASESDHATQIPAADLGTLAPTDEESPFDPRQLGLTERQIDVLNLLLMGLPNKLICRRLGLAEGTVKVHVSAVFRALAVRNRAQAVVAAVKLGLDLSSAH
jgi:DNA-binding NarL/FixJ family response regulator